LNDNNQKFNILNFSSFNNKLKSHHRDYGNLSNYRYFSNGLIFQQPNSLFNSTQLNKSNYLTSNKSSYNSVNTNNTINNRAKSSSTTSTIPIVNLPSSQHISELNLINENKVYEIDNKQSAHHATSSISKKRSILRNKHYNLMSLDENALYSYRKEHKLNQTEHYNKTRKKCLINKTNLSVISANSTTLNSNKVYLRIQLYIFFFFL
jgi:hypothetical protein